MDYRNLGRTGLKVSELCMGTMQFGWTADEATSFDVLDASWAAGINFYDTADVYTIWIEGNPGGVSEEILGKWMKKAGIRREEIVLATKVRGKMSENPLDQGLSRQHIMKSVDDSLRRMGTDYIDLYQAHSVDPETPIDETLRAFDDLVRMGKVRYIGASNYTTWRMMEALWTSDRDNIARYDSLQPHYNLVNRAEFERELADVCRTYGVGVIPYSPLAGGFLTGKYRKDQEIPENSRGQMSARVKGYMTDANWALLDKMEAMGKEKDGASISQLALAWQLSDPVITSPIIGPRNMEQFNDNIRAVSLRLDAEEKAELDEMTDWR